MIYTIQAPEEIQVQIQLPASKSISNRILVMNALCENPYPVENISDSDDTRVMLQAFQSESSLIDIGAAGTSMRFLTAYLSQRPGTWKITGTERMKNRPIKTLVDALRKLGGELNYPEKEGFPPLQIRGKKLQGGQIYLDGSVSSQYISALMMIAPAMEKGLILHLEGNIASRPYIAMTVRLMEKFGIKVYWEDQTIRIEPQSYTPVRLKVESDWSAASYWYEIMTLIENGKVELLGLERDSMQGDAACSGLFKHLGVKTGFTKHGLLLQADNTVKNQNPPLLSYDFTNEPDLAQTLLVTCCLSDIPFRFTGLQSLRIKETDRISALQTEIRKLGYLIEVEGNSIMSWTGTRCNPEPHPVISTYEDHRMAMAFAPACLKTGEIRIENPEVVSKSYPDYWNDLRKSGFAVSAAT